MKYLLDTNVLSESVKKKPDHGVLELFEKQQHEIATAAPVWHELQFGCRRLPHSRRRKAIDEFLTNVVQRTMPILPYDEMAAQWHAKERARLSAKGIPPSFVDGQIAAIAFVNNLVLVTRNVQDFQSFSGIKIEIWHIQQSS